MSNIIQLFKKESQESVWVFSSGYLATGHPREHRVKRNVAEVLLEYTKNAYGSDESEAEIWGKAFDFLKKQGFSNMELKDAWEIRDDKTFPDCWDRLTEEEQRQICNALECFRPEH